MTDVPATHATADLDPAFVPDAAVTVENLSVWFGQNVVLSELSCSFGPGVTGLLGPNGAGKTTLMRTVCGLMPANAGRVRVFGQDPRTDRSIQRAIALVPEEDAVPESLSPRQLARYSAVLSRVPDPDAAVEWALDQVDLRSVADRPLGGFSKGMRQRGKIAAALVTNPNVLVLDEPLNGADPVQRVALIELFTRLGTSGRTVIVSSHVLHEVERLAPRVVVILSGRLAAAGGHRAIRDAMADRPRRVLVRSSDNRALAAELLKAEAISAVSIEAMSQAGGRPNDEMILSTLSATDLAHQLPRVAMASGTRLREVRPLDESLESVFSELTA